MPRMETKVTAYLGLGSNLDDRVALLRGARQALQKNPAVTVMASSPLYETAAVGGPDGQPPYLNAVLKIETVLGPEKLLQSCQQIEKEFGRQRNEKWGPRTLDIDILLYTSILRMDPDLILPHPRMHERAFVLCPLVDLNPEIIHPVVYKTVSELLFNLDATEGVQRIAELW